MFPFRSRHANVARNHACTQYIFRWIHLKRQDASWI
jgi:hypothetical protein